MQIYYFTPKLICLAKALTTITYTINIFSPSNITRVKSHITMYTIPNVKAGGGSISLWGHLFFYSRFCLARCKIKMNPAENSAAVCKRWRLMMIFIIKQDKDHKHKYKAAQQKFPGPESKTQSNPELMAGFKKHALFHSVHMYKAEWHKKHSLHSGDADKT